MIEVADVAALAAHVPGADQPDAAEVADLRDRLGHGLLDITAGWARPDGVLGITKGRLFAARRCPASLCGELGPPTLGQDLAVGVIVDAAAALLAVSTKVPGRASWLDAIVGVLRQTEPALAGAIADLPIDVRDELRTLVQQRCEGLRGILGDLTATDTTAQERARVLFGGAGVALSGRADLVIGGPRRSIVEVKSGSVRPSHVDELGFYALLFALRDGVAPAAVAAVTLDPPTISAHAVTWDMLEGVAARVLETAQTLVAVDQATAAGTWPRTEPGAVCSWCSAAPRCPDAPDIAIAEQQARRSDWRARPSADEAEELVDDAADDEPW